MAEELSQPLLQKGTAGKRLTRVTVFVKLSSALSKGGRRVAPSVQLPSQGIIKITVHLDLLIAFLF